MPEHASAAVAGTGAAEASRRGAAKRRAITFRVVGFVVLLVALVGGAGSRWPGTPGAATSWG